MLRNWYERACILHTYLAVVANSEIDVVNGYQASLSQIITGAGSVMESTSWAHASPRVRPKGRLDGTDVNALLAYISAHAESDFLCVSLDRTDVLKTSGRRSPLWPGRLDREE